MHEVSVEKASTIQLPDLIDSVINGDELVFTQDNLPVARLTAIRNGKPTPKFVSAEGLFVMTGDFDAPLADFDEYRK